MTTRKIFLSVKGVLAKLLWLEPLWVCILAPFILLPGRLIATSWQPYLILLLGLFWVIRWFVHHCIFPSTPLNWCLWVILLWLPINFLAAIDKGRAWQAIGYLALGIALFVALVDWPPARQHPQLIVWLFLLITLGLTMLGPLLLADDLVVIVPLMVMQTKLQPFSAQLGETINSNILAGGLTIAIPMQAALALRQDWSQHRLASISMGILCLSTIGALLLTASRGAELAVVVAIALVLLLRWPKLLYLTPIIAILMAIYSYWWSLAQILEILTFNTKVGGVDQRVEIWMRAYYALQDFVFTGIGIGNFNLVIPQLYPYFSIPVDIDIPHAHNLLLQIGVDLGLPGLIAYLGLLINVFMMLLASLRRHAKSLSWTLAAGAFGSLVAMLVHGIVDAPVWDTKLAFIPWLLFALVTLLYLPENDPYLSKA